MDEDKAYQPISSRIPQLVQDQDSSTDFGTPNGQAGSETSDDNHCNVDTFGNTTRMNEEEEETSEDELAPSSNYKRVSCTYTIFLYLITLFSLPHFRMTSMSCSD